MDHIVALSLPIGKVRTDPDAPNRSRDTPAEDHLLRSSIRRRGILEPLQVSSEAESACVIIDGERRYRIAKELGYDRLICMVHPYMSAESREELRMELKLSAKQVA